MKWFKKQYNVGKGVLVVEYIGHNHDKHNYFSVYWNGNVIIRVKRGQYGQK